MSTVVKNLWLLISGLCTTISVTAQQDPMYSQYMFNGLVLNPAYAGSHGNISGTALYRQQWTGIDGAPATQSISLHGPLTNDKVGLGLSIVNDKIGITNTLNINTAYAFMIQTSAGKLALGLQAGVVQYKIDYSRIQFSDQLNENANAYNVNQLRPAFGGGLYYYSYKFYIGLSSPRILSFSLKKDSLHNPVFAGHYFLNAGFIFKLTAPFKLKPSMLIKSTNGSMPQLDLNATLYYQDLLGFGISYRSFESVTGLFQILIAKKFRIGYAYDYGATGGLQKYNSGSHEIMLQVELILKKDKIISPRYF